MWGAMPDIVATYDEVRVQAALVRLVHHQAAVAPQQKVVLYLAEQDAVRHELHGCPVPKAAVVPHLQRAQRGSGRRLNMYLANQEPAKDSSLWQPCLALLRNLKGMSGACCTLLGMVRQKDVLGTLDTMTSWQRCGAGIGLNLQAWGHIYQTCGTRLSRPQQG